MKITKLQLKQIIKEELSKVLNESPGADFWQVSWLKKIRGHPSSVFRIPKSDAATQQDAVDYAAKYILQHPEYPSSLKQRFVTENLEDMVDVTDSRNYEGAGAPPQQLPGVSDQFIADLDAGKYGEEYL